MTNNDLVLIHTAADALAACGAFSRANPTVALKDNPHNRAADRAMRAARKLFPRTGMWGCPTCDAMLPTLNDAHRTTCCDATIAEM